MHNTQIAPMHARSVALPEILAQFPQLSLGFGSTEGIIVTGVTGSSRIVKSGDLYVAIPGANVHGAQFAGSAVDAGAVAIVTDQAGAEMLGESIVGTPILVCDSPRDLLGELAALVYPSAGIRFIAPTGTNGKTSTAFIAEHILQKIGEKTSITTTIERRIGDEVIPSDLTTPEADVLHAMQARAAELGVTASVIEVSAHALSWQRINGIVFDAVGFLNFSQDHLDDYPSIDDYFAAKCALFTPAHARRGVVCIDSDWGEKLLAQAEVPCETLSLTDKDADWQVSDIDADRDTTAFTVTAPNGLSQRISVEIPGEFTAQNTAMAIAMICAAGWDTQTAFDAVADGVSVVIPGRLELVSKTGQPRVYVDYAHTPEAIRELLIALRPVTNEKLIAVLGADGDRDSTKRHAMGLHAATHADTLIITDYNPRREDPAQIRQMLLAGADAAESDVEIIEIDDQKVAIWRAIKVAQADDTVVIIGPGHENVRYINGNKVPFSARDEARAALAEFHAV